MKSEQMPWKIAVNKNLLTGKRDILWLWLIDFQHTRFTQVPVPSNHSAKFCLWGTSGLYSWSLLSTFQSIYLQTSFKLIFRCLSFIRLYYIAGTRDQTLASFSFHVVLFPPNMQVVNSVKRRQTMFRLIAI